MPIILNFLHDQKTVFICYFCKRNSVSDGRTATEPFLTAFPMNIWLSMVMNPIQATYTKQQEHRGSVDRSKLKCFTIT